MLLHPLKTKMGKAQISTEFIFAAGTVMLIFLLIFYFTFERQIDTNQIGKTLDARGECLKISNMISGVYSSGDGTVAKTRTSYIISVSGNHVTVKERSVEKALCSFTGKSGEYGLLTGELLIRNENGVIAIENEIS